MLSTIPKEKINNLILNYFIQEGYEQAAALFAKDIGVELDSNSSSKKAQDDQFHFTEGGYTNVTVDQRPSAQKRRTKGYSTIKERTEIKLAILRGDITDAVRLISTLFPTVLDGNNLLHFKLLRLNLIEMIRAHKLGNSGTDESEFLQKILGFVRENLISKVTTSSKLLQELEVTMSLLCFNFDPTKDIEKQRDLPGQLRALFNLSLRNQCYRLVNRAILELDDKEDVEYTGPSFTGLDFGNLEDVQSDFDEDCEEDIEYTIAPETAPVEYEDDFNRETNALLDSRLEQVIKLYSATEQRLVDLQLIPETRELVI